MAADRAFSSAMGALIAALGETQIPSMIIGGVAVIARGVPRETVDIDATILGEEVDLSALLQTLQKHGIVPRIEEAERFARKTQVLLLRHAESGIPIDLSLAWLPFEREALARATELEYEGHPVRIATAEDLIVYKATAWRERDVADIRRLLALHFEQIDLERIRPIIEEIFRLLGAEERIVEFDRLLASVGGHK